VLHDFALPTQLPLSLPSQLVRQRPDVLEAEDTLHQASAQVGVAEAARFPSFNISAQYAQQSGRRVVCSPRPRKSGPPASMSHKPVFAGGRLRAREKEARQRFLQAQAQYRGTVIDAFTEVADACRRSNTTLTATTRTTQHWMPRGPIAISPGFSSREGG